MAKKTEIEIDKWNDAIGGKSNNPLGDDHIKSMANDGELIVVGYDGSRFDPIALEYGGWDLRPNPTIELSYEKWVSEAGAGMNGTSRYQELHRAAELGNLVVIDNMGKRFVPVKFGDNWKLEPEK